MLFVAIIGAVLTLVMFILGLFPLPVFEWASSVGHFASAVNSFLSLIPSGIRWVSYLVGPKAWGVAVFMLDVYLIFMGVFTGLLAWHVFKLVWNFVRAFLFSGD